MKRIAIVLYVCSFVGCSQYRDPVGVGRKAESAIEDGGSVASADHAKVEAFCVSLGNVQSAEQEKEVLAEFGEWLEGNGYKIRVLKKSGGYELSCPHFPPVTPWIDYSFFDIQNLELLPQ